MHRDYNGNAYQTNTLSHYFFEKATAPAASD